MTITLHGGSCCGISHVHGLRGYEGDYGIPDPNLFMDACKQAFDNNVENTREYATRFHYRDEKGGHTLEVTTAVDVEGCGQTDWCEYLAETGWNPSYQFQNGNSGNTVTVWHKTFTSADFKETKNA
jgi:hypothetical protein